MVLNLPPGIREYRCELIKSKNKIVCSNCYGKGYEKFGDPIKLCRPCPKCRGYGEVYWTENIILNRKFVPTNPIICNNVLIRNIKDVGEYLDIICRGFGCEAQINISPIKFTFEHRILNWGPEW